MPSFERHLVGNMMKVERNPWMVAEVTCLWDGDKLLGLESFPEQYATFTVIHCVKYDVLYCNWESKNKIRFNERKNLWQRRGSNSRGLPPIGNQENLKSNALDQLGHATNHTLSNIARDKQ